MKPRETAKTKLIRLVFFASNVVTLGLGLALCYLGGSQQVDPEARARAANLTAALLPAELNSTLAGAEANAAPYSRMLTIGVVIVVESLLGILGALRTQKHRDRRRGVLLCYHAVLLATASSCIWMAVMCLFFASQADECVAVAARPATSRRARARRTDALEQHAATAPLRALKTDRRRRALAQVRRALLDVHRGGVSARHLRDGRGGDDRRQPDVHRGDRRDHRHPPHRRSVLLRPLGRPQVSHALDTHLDERHLDHGGCGPCDLRARRRE
jgi:hypothetical protein